MNSCPSAIAQRSTFLRVSRTMGLCTYLVCHDFSTTHDFLLWIVRKKGALGHTVKTGYATSRFSVRVFRYTVEKRRALAVFQLLGRRSSAATGDDFESAASASSAIPATEVSHLHLRAWFSLRRFAFVMGMGRRKRRRARPRVSSCDLREQDLSKGR